MQRTMEGNLLDFNVTDYSSSRTMPPGIQYSIWPRNHKRFQKVSTMHASSHLRAFLMQYVLLVRKFSNESRMKVLVTY